MKWLILWVVVIWSAALGARAADLNVPIIYLERVVPPPPTLSNLDPKPQDLGQAGAALGIEDNATTGRFLGHEYGLETILVEEGEDILAAAKDALTRSAYLLLNMPPDDISTIADSPEAASAILFNIGAPHSELRGEKCRANLLHTIPSRHMLSDALTQFAMKKRWTNWAMIVGPRPEDALFAETLTASAKKFGISINDRAEWSFDADMRRSAAQEVPLFTQDFEDHDLLVVADEINDFARYVQYNTWLPRPLAGSWGITPAAWSASVEQHGAAQLQGRFNELAGRAMQPEDYAAMMAVRAIGEAVTRTNSDEPQMLRSYLLSDEFEIGGFKGRPLSFRDWNGQLRQPIPLAHPGAVVALAPLDGFLHQFNELDTLGVDRPNSACEAFKK